MRKNWNESNITMKLFILFLTLAINITKYGIFLKSFKYTLHTYTFILFFQWI